VTFSKNSSKKIRKVDEVQGIKRKTLIINDIKKGGPIILKAKS
jgi:hypothetical protein